MLKPVLSPVFRAVLASVFGTPSSPTPPPDPLAPSFTEEVQITGDLQPGHIVYGLSTYVGYPEPTVIQKWYFDDVEFDGANQHFIVMPSDKSGQTLKTTVHISNDLGEDDSETTRVVPAAEDPYWDYVRSVYNFQGADGSTKLVDGKGNAFTWTDGVAISTANFPAGALSTTGKPQAILIADTTEHKLWELRNLPFTLEVLAKSDGTNTYYQAMMDTSGNGSALGGFFLENSSQRGLLVAGQSPSLNSWDPTFNPNDGELHMYALDRGVEGVLNLYVDYQRVATGDGSAGSTLANGLAWAGYLNAAANGSFQGDIVAARLTIGRNRFGGASYNGNYLLPFPEAGLNSPPVSVRRTIWLDGKDPTTLSHVGDQFTSWKSKPYGQVFTASGTPPVYVPNEGVQWPVASGVPYIQGAGDQSYNNGLTLYILATVDGADGVMGDFGSTGWVTMDGTVNGVFGAAFRSGGATLVSGAGGGKGVKRLMVVRANVDTAGTVRINGDAQAMALNSVFSAISYPAVGGSASYLFEGTIHEIIGYDAQHTDAEIEATEAYFTTKWSL